jgi:hypothetical protein
MALLPALPAAGSTNWYSHYQALHAQGDAQEATLNNHEQRLLSVEGGGNTSLVGTVQVDSFTGATDDIKLDNALLYASQQTRIPYIQFPARSFAWNKAGRVPFTGMKLVGPNAPGWKNLEIANGQPVNHRILFGAGIGTGTSAAFVGNGLTLYDTYVGNLAFQANNNGQFWEQSTGNMYMAEWEALNFYGMVHALGRPAAAARVTGMTFTGNWTIQAYTGSAGSFITMGGSDSELWTSGMVNFQGGQGSSSGGQGSFLMTLSSMSKTNVGRAYITAESGWRALKVTGNGSGLSFWGSTFEGRNAGTPCPGALVRWEAGTVGSMYGCWFAYGMTAPTINGGDNNGIIDVRGGDVLIDRPYYDRANGVAETVPLIYVGAGADVTARVAGRIHGAVSPNPWTGRPRIQIAAGGTATYDSTFTLV